MVIEEIRKTDRFIAHEPMTGTFGATEVTLLNVSIGGAQISHALPMRIGTAARISFRRGDAVIAIQARVIWSHVLPNSGGKLLYRSGLTIEGANPQYALALNTLIRAGVLRQDVESLDRKRKRDMEREEKKRSGPRVIPTSEPPPA